MERLVLQLPWSELPPRYTCDGDNRSPPLRIEGLQDGVRSLVLMVYHPHETGCCSFCAWLIWNLPPVTSIPEGIPLGTEVRDPIPGTQGTNDYGRVGYNGPCPSVGSSHRVNYKVYGLNGHLAVPGGSFQKEVIPAMRDHVLQFGETFAMYRR